MTSCRDALAMRLSTVFVLSALLAAAQAVPSTTFVPKVKESVFPPRAWTIRGRAPADRMIELRIALPQPNFGLLEQNLYEVR